MEVGPFVDLKFRRIVYYLPWIALFIAILLLACSGWSFGRDVDRSELVQRWENVFLDETGGGSGGKDGTTETVVVHESNANGVRDLERGMDVHLTSSARNSHSNSPDFNILSAATSRSPNSVGRTARDNASTIRPPAPGLETNTNLASVDSDREDVSINIL